MNIILFLALHLLVRSTFASGVLLPLNPQGRFRYEIQSVHHLISAHQIAIELLPSRRCHTPTFRIRISGTSLRIAELEVAEANKYVYSYPPLVDEGAYFVEVLALLCSPFNPENFAETCLEEVAEGSNVVTLPYTFHVAAKETNAEKGPRWLLSKKQNATFLPTRYQKLGCMSETFPYWCPAEPAHVAQYDLYKWVDRPDYTKLLGEVISLSRKKEKKPGKNIIRVCSVGDSHSRDLVKYGNLLGLKIVHFTWVRTLYPAEFNIDMLKKHACSYAVVTYGQWPASFMMSGQPYTRSKYQKEMHRVIALLQKYDPKQAQVFVRSENYNSLGARETACPPIDHRSPPVIDMYNAVLKNVSQELHVEYIDLNHIMGPMWDSALDWCHPADKVYNAEVEWILYYIFQSSSRRNLAVNLHAPEFPDNSLISFTYSETVYLVQTGLLRAFPNARTMDKMGYKSSKIKKLNIDRIGEFVVGADLPEL